MHTHRAWSTNTCTLPPWCTLTELLLTTKIDARLGTIATLSYRLLCFAVLMIWLPLNSNLRWVCVVLIGASVFYTFTRAKNVTMNTWSQTSLVLVIHRVGRELESPQPFYPLKLPPTLDKLHNPFLFMHICLQVPWLKTCKWLVSLSSYSEHYINVNKSLKWAFLLKPRRLEDPPAISLYSTASSVTGLLLVCVPVVDYTHISTAHFIIRS